MFPVWAAVCVATGQTVDLDSYLRLVYPGWGGQLTDPISENNLDFVYGTPLTEVAATATRVGTGQGSTNPLCPGLNEWYTGAMLLPPRSAARNRGTKARSAIHRGWVEVMHAPDLRPNIGMWFYALRGTGLYVNVGTTATFTNHAAAIKELLNETVPEWPMSVSQFTAMKNAAVRAGFDTLQFTEHCDNRCGCIGTEIMFARINGTSVCGVDFRNGLGGTNACTCDPNAKFANCPNTIALIHSPPKPSSAPSVQLHVGPSPWSDTANATLPAGAETICASSINYTRFGGENAVLYPEARFNVTLMGQNISVTRIDQPAGWTFDLVVYCTAPSFFGGATPASAADLMIALAMILGAGAALFRLSPTWVAAGFAVWLPANAIADEMPVLVSLNGATTAAVVTIAMQAGNIGLLLVPKFSARAMTVVSVAAGFAAFGIMLAPGNILVVACSAFLAGGAGAVGSTVLWGQIGDADVVSFSTGLSLACFVSGAAIMAQEAGEHPTFGPAVYFGALLLLHSVLICIARSALPTTANQLAPVNDLTHDESDQVPIYDINDDLELPLINGSPDPAPAAAPVPSAIKPHSFIAMGWLYSLAYSLPALWPFFLQRSGYRYVLIVSNVADTLGRLKLVDVQLWVAVAGMLYMAAASAIAVGMEWAPELPWVYAVVVAVAMGLRGAAITTAQGKASPQDRRKYGYAGQAGSTVGGLLGLFVFLLH